MYQTNPPRPPWETLPTMYDLPSEEIGEPVSRLIYFHRLVKLKASPQMKYLQLVI
jgi:hypothetical protein